MNSEKKPRGRGGQKTPGNKTHSQSVRQPRKAEPSDQNSHSDNHKNSAIKDAPCQVASCDNNVKQASVGCIPKQVSDLEGDNQKQCDIMDTNIQIKSQIPNSSNRNMTEQDFYANSLQNIETAPQTLNQMDEQASGGCIPKQVSDLECDNQKQCDVMDTNIQIKSQIPNSSNRNMTEQDFYANTNLQNIETAPQTWNKMESYEETEIQNICLPDNRPNGYMHIDSNCRTLIDSYQEKPQFLPAKKGEHRFEKENEQFDAEEIELVDAKMNKGSDTEDDGNSNAKLSDSFDATPNRNESFSTEPKKQLSKETKDNGKIHIEGIENMEDKEYDHKNVNFQIMPNKCSDSCSLNSSDGKQNEEFKSKQHEKHDINEDTFFNKEKHDYDSKSLEDKNEKLAEENVKPVVIQNECSGAEQNDKQSKGNVELDLQNECPEARLNEKHSREDELDVMQNECTQIKEREKHLKNEYSKSKQNVKSVEETEDYDSMQNENVHPGVKHVGSEAKPDGKHSEEHHRPEVMQNEYPKPKLNEKYAQKYEKLDDMKDETEVKPHEQLGARRKVEQNIVHVKENKEHDSVQREYCKTIQEEHMKENEEPYLGQNKCLEKKQTDRLVKENEMPNAVQINAGHHECFTTKQIKLLDKEDENNGLQYPDTEGEDQVEDELRKEDTCNDEHEKENKKVVTQNKKSYDERPNNQLHNKPGEMLLNAIVNVTAGQSEQVGVIENIQFDDRESDQLKENEHILKSKELHAELSKKANLKKCEVDSNDVCKFSSKLNEEQMVKISEEQNPNGKESELLSIKPNEEYICVSQGRPSERQMKNDDRSMQKLNDRSVQELNDMSVQKNYSTPVQNLHHVEKKLNNQNEDKEFNNQEQDNKQNSFQDVKKFQGQQNIYQEKQNLDTDIKISEKSSSVPGEHSDNMQYKNKQYESKEQNSPGHHMPSHVQYDTQKNPEPETYIDSGRQFVTIDAQFNMSTPLKTTQQDKIEEISKKLASTEEMSEQQVNTSCSNHKLNNSYNEKKQRKEYQPNAYQRSINQEKEPQVDDRLHSQLGISEVNESVGKDNEDQARDQNLKRKVMQPGGQQDYHRYNDQYGTSRQGGYNNGYKKCESQNRHSGYGNQHNFSLHYQNYGYENQQNNSLGWHQQDRGSRSHSFNKGRGGKHNQQYSQPQQQQEHSTSTQEMLRMLTCDKCKEAFNHLKKIPKSLHCGHTCCTECAQQLLNNSEISCPFCKKKTYNVRCARNLACNQSILKLIPKITDKAIVTVSRTDSPVNQLNVSKVSLMGEHYEKPVMTRDKKQSMQFPRQNDSRREFNIMSPHNSQCLGAGVDPSAYCTKCQQWICDVCRKVDHHETRGCILNPLKETITKMKQKHENNSSSACETLNGSVKELKSYCDQLDGLLLSMRAAFECIGAEHEDLKKAVQEGTQMERNLKDLVLKSQSSRNLSETLANFKDIENCCVTSQEWMSNVMSQVSGSNTVKKVAKDLICMTLKSLRTSASENGEVNQIVACHESTTTRFSVLTVEGGRIHLHCLTSSTPGQATQKLPLECFTSCMNTTSSLVFINLSWGGSTRGRVYIRLTGDTVRGRQFLKLCTGEMGPSFCNTNFHRVWWKGYPGESIWGGDFEHGDGSGEVTFTSGLDSEQTTALSRSVPIIAGLVAGRYEKKNTSSIFRIYTMDSKNCVEEAAFGQVEFGLDVIQNAVKHSNISDVVISDCGIVMEF